jgi:RNA polymerase sigma factor (sigma-70 family)
MDPGESADRSRDDDTQALFARSGEGDPAAVRELLARHVDWVRGHVRGRLTPPMRRECDTNDVVQDVMVRVLKTRTPISFRGPEQFRAYVACVVGRTLASIAGRHLAHKREAARERELVTGILDGSLGERPAKDVTRPDDRASRAELVDLLLAAVDLLEGPEQDVLWLRLREGMEYRALGVRLGIAEDAVRMRFRRAVEHLFAKFTLLRANRIDEALTA